MPRTLPCKTCGVKPKREVIGWGFSDKDDELFLVHKCKGSSVRFPEKGRFYSTRPEFQERLLIPAWNEEFGLKAKPAEGNHG